MATLMANVDGSSEGDVVLPGGLPDGSSAVITDMPDTADADNIGSPTGTTSAGDKPTPKHGDHDDKSKSLDPEVAEGWSFLLESSQEYDQKQLEGWRDDLNNLLVFAGLFSAVVTAYTIESYQWLQADSGDQTVQLLTQISSQLASFSVTPAFINTTVQPLLSPPPFHPADIDVTINMLWFLSLNLSLLAAFFAIAVQQWLRSLPLPQHLGAQGTIYLRHKRHTAFIMCQVPHLITLLPVVLQISVVLFLVGLYHFLHELSQPITIAVTTVAGTPFTLYAISLFLPLIWPQCPFKSPLVPSMVFILRWTFIIIMVLASVLLMIPAYVLSIIGLFLWEYCTKCSVESAEQAADLAVLRIYDSFFFMFNILFTAVVSALVRPGSFWVDQEFRRYHREFATWDLSVPLAWAPNAVPIHQLSRLRPCLLQFNVGQRTQCVMQWIILPYMGRFSSADYGRSRIYEWSPIHEGILQEVDKTFTEQYKTFLLDAVPSDAETAESDWVQVDEDLAAIIVLLVQIVKTDSAEPDFRATVVQILIRLLRAQRFNTVKDVNKYSKARFPAVCLFECAAHDEYAFSLAETTTLLVLLDRFITEILGLDKELRDDYRINTVELVFSLTATALVAVAQRTQNHLEDSNNIGGLRDSVHKALSAFDRFVESEKINIQIMGEAAHARREEKMIVNREAAKSTVDSLLMTANAGRFAPSDIDLVGTIAHHLTQAFEKENVFGNMFEALQHLRLLCPVPQPASQPSMSTDVALIAGKPSDGEDANKDSTDDDIGSSIYYDRHEHGRSNSSENLLAAVSALPYDEHFESDTIPLLSLPSPPRNI